MAGIYIHVPFCKHKCIYCDFASYENQNSKIDLYFACLYREIKGRSELLKGKIFDTVYFGGGTPSYVEPKYILGVMRQLKYYYTISQNAEITLEINPGTLTEEKYKIYKEIGINRFSVGLQSADDKMLKSLGRIHTKQDFIDACHILKNNNFSVDVMIGLENHKTSEVKDSIDLAIQNGAKHISVYALTPEDGTPMYGKYLNGDLPDGDTVAELYEFSVKYLKENNFNRYEVSNFALKGCESKHNLNYWNRGEYIGFGLSSSSFINGRRFTNTEKIDEYTMCILNNKVPEVYSEEIDIDGQKEEFIMLALRTSLGLDKNKFNKLFNSNFDEEYKDKLLKISKYVENTQNNLRIKDEYLFIQNSIIVELI